MKKFIQSVLASLTVAALIANVTLLWNFNTRLTRIETLFTKNFYYTKDEHHN